MRPASPQQSVPHVGAPPVYRATQTAPHSMATQGSRAQIVAGAAPHPQAPARITPQVVLPKMAGDRLPGAPPPVYRPQAAGFVQGRLSPMPNIGVGKCGPRQSVPLAGAPPVYRPTQTAPHPQAPARMAPQVVLPKTAGDRRPGAPPPVYRPQAAGFVQSRLSPAPNIGVGKWAPQQSVPHAGAPPVYRATQTAPHSMASQGSRTQMVTGAAGLPPRMVDPSAAMKRDEREVAAVGDRPLNQSSQGAVQRTAAVCQPKKRARGRLKTRGWYTQSGKYFIADHDPHKLYSYWGADPPQPVSLFTKSWEFTSGLFWTVWTPRVQFLTQETIDSEKSTQEYQRASSQIGTGPFVFGKNDCSNFATLLSGLITNELNLGPQASVDLKDYGQLASYNNVTVGAKIHHDLHNCPDAGYHAATVVAMDGKDLVTLEANVSRTITRPEFYIRSGVLGFAKDNNPEDLYGANVRISRVDGSVVDRASGRIAMWQNKELSDQSFDTVLERGLVYRA
jgi:hypothetical protein